MSVLHRSVTHPRPTAGPAPRLLTRLRPPARLVDESGIALIMAVIVMFVLTIMVTAAIAFTSSDSRNASFSQAGQKAYAAAEAGVNNALTYVQKAGSDTTGVPTQPASATNTAGSQETDLPNGVKVFWGGSYDASTKVWTVKAISTVPNPTGSGSLVTRTITQTATITPPPFNFVALDTGCDVHTLIVDSSGLLTVTNSIYVNSCNGTVQNQKPDAFDIFGSGGNISAPSIGVVGGWETDGGNYPNTDTVTVNGILCPLAKGNLPLASPQPTGCPATGQPAIGDPLAGKVSPPTLGSAACSPGTAASPAPCTIASGTVTLQPGTYYGGICIGAVIGTTCGSNIGGSCQPGTPGATAYSPNVTLNGSINSSTTSIPVHWSGFSTPDPVSTGDVIKIGNEQMLVTNAPGTNGSATLTVTRHYNGTSAASHSSGTTVYEMPQVGTAHVTFAPGTYIMAGGGLFLCGLSTLSAPNVLLYNTKDPSHTSGSGAIDQIEINTTGSVSLGPQASGAYEGLTVYQDPNLAVAPSDTCENRTYFGNNPGPTQSQINEYDIALMSMASSGPNGELGSVSGSFYAPAYTATLADSVSGKANLAVLTSCILVDGGNSTFDFKPAGLFGGSWILGPQSG